MNLKQAASLKIFNFSLNEDLSHAWKYNTYLVKCFQVINSEQVKNKEYKHRKNEYEMAMKQVAANYNYILLTK